jgi:hypothetical protein
LTAGDKYEFASDAKIAVLRASRTPLDPEALSARNPDAPNRDRDKPFNGVVELLRVVG